MADNRFSATGDRQREVCSSGKLLDWDNMDFYVMNMVDTLESEVVDVYYDIEKYPTHQKRYKVACQVVRIELFAYAENG